MDHLRLRIDLCQESGSFQAVLFRPPLKIHIVKQSDYAPKVWIFSSFLSEVAHDTLNGKTVENVKGFLIVFLQQGQGLTASDGCFHEKASLQIYPLFYGVLVGLSILKSS